MPDTPSITLLRRLREWDMFSIPDGDHEYWTAEIDKVLAGDKWTKELPKVKGAYQVWMDNWPEWVEPDVVEVILSDGVLEIKDDYGDWRPISEFGYDWWIGPMQLASCPSDRLHNKQEQE